MLYPRKPLYEYQPHRKLSGRSGFVFNRRATLHGQPRTGERKQYVVKIDISIHTWVQSVGACRPTPHTPRTTISWIVAS